jgi:hypothetical protein
MLTNIISYAYLKGIPILYTDEASRGDFQRKGWFPHSMKTVVQQRPYDGHKINLTGRITQFQRET